MKFQPARRRFLLSGALVGGGLLIGYGLFKPRDLLGDGDVLPVADDQVALNAWLKIAADGTVTVAVPRAEMGQGIYTALPMLVAEELDVPWSRIAVEQAPINTVYGNIALFDETLPLDPEDHGWLAQTARWSMRRVGRVLGVQVTGGSTSVRDAWLPMRTAGAAARDMLVRAAAARLDVDPDDLVVDDGTVIHRASARSLTYGGLAQEAAALRPPHTVRFKQAQDWRYLGKPVARLDIPDKCTGAAGFGIDHFSEDMLFAAIRIAPVFGGTLGEVDLEKLRVRAGVSAVVAMDDAVAVVGKSYWHAERALAEADIAFAGGANGAASSADIFAAYARALDAQDCDTYEDRGDDGELDGADAIAAEYRVPLLAHACMEPMNCSVRIERDRAEIWYGNQAPDLMRRIAADALHMEPTQVSVHTPLLGGGFGRRGEPDVMLRAIAIARELPGRTIKLVYSREQDLQHDTYRPAVLSRFRARLDEDGRIRAWHNRLASPSVSAAVMGRAFPALPSAGRDRTNIEGAAFLPYAVPHRRVEHARVDIPVPVGFWRSVGHSFNAFFTECFIDELALAAGRDPIDFRLDHLEARPRERHVLTSLRRLGGWDTPVPAGRARGVALHESFHSIVGQLAEVSVSAGEITVHKVCCVVDCGQVVNPDTIFAQMESAIVFGLSAALHGDVQLEHGRIRQSNFPDYRILALREMPHIETHVIASGAPPGGIGEPGTPPIAPAVANALARLTGERQRNLPLRA